MEVTNLFELKSHLQEQCDKDKSYDECLKILNSYEIIGIENIQEYFDYLMPMKLVLEEQSNKDMLDIPSQAQKSINDEEAKKIQVQTKDA